MRRIRNIYLAILLNKQGNTQNINISWSIWYTRDCIQARTHTYTHTSISQQTATDQFSMIQSDAPNGHIVRYIKHIRYTEKSSAEDSSDVCQNVNNNKNQNSHMWKTIWMAYKCINSWKRPSVIFTLFSFHITLLCLFLWLSDILTFLSANFSLQASIGINWQKKDNTLSLSNKSAQ